MEIAGHFTEGPGPAPVHRHSEAAGRIGDQVLADTLGGQNPHLWLQVLGVGFADQGATVGDWEHAHGVHPAGVYRRSLGDGVQQTGVFGHLRRTSLPTLARVSNNPVQQ